MTEKDYKNLLDQIEDNTDIVDNLTEIAIMMKDIVAYDRHMSIDSKMRFLFLYLQHRNECAHHLISKTAEKNKITEEATENKLTILKRLKNLFFK